jgi:ankyrin repeat protein
MSQSPTPLEREAELAAKAGDAAKLRECLDKGARFGTFVYMYAVASGDVDTFRAILDHGGDINYCLGGMSGSPLINSLEHKHDALLEFLFAQGVDPNQNLRGPMLGPLGVSVSCNIDVKWTERLLQAGARVEGSGALHIAAYLGSLPKMRILLQHGANVDEVPERRISAQLGFNKKGTPIHWAIAGGSTDAVLLLLEHGPNFDVVDWEGVSVKDRLRKLGTLYQELHARNLLPQATVSQEES